MLSVQNLCKKYEGSPFELRNLNFQMRTGEVLFITGHSGAGKSTLLRMIGLLEPANAGEIYFFGVPMSQVPPRQMPLYRRLLGMVFQDHQLLPTRNVFDNVALPLGIAGVDVGVIRDQVQRVLAQVGLSGRETYYPSQLSTGQQQRVGIARALVHRPKLILADEPTGNLDPDLSLEIMALFQSIAEAGTSVIIATHDISLVARYAKRLLHLKKGELVNAHLDTHEMGVEAADIGVAASAAASRVADVQVPSSETLDTSDETQASDEQGAEDQQASGERGSEDQEADTQAPSDETPAVEAELVGPQLNTRERATQASTQQEGVEA